MDRLGIPHQEDQPDIADELRGQRQALQRISELGNVDASNLRTGEGISGMTNRQRLEQLLNLGHADDISPPTSLFDITASDSAIDIQQSDTLESSTADTGEGAAPDQAGSSEAARMSIDTISSSTSIPPGDSLQGQNAQRPAAPTWEHFMGLFDLVRDLTDQTSRLERAQQA
jgi:hypothetical protein